MSTTESAASRPAVHIYGGDQQGWALDENRRLIGQALDPMVRLTSLSEATVLHTIWFHTLAHAPVAALEGKRILCHTSNDTDYHFHWPEFALAAERVGLWLARNEEVAAKLTRYGLPNRLLPYVVDQRVFRPLDSGTDPAARRAARRQWGVPEEAYLVGSFQRDSEGSDRQRPKLAKGPDVFAELLAALVREGLPVHAVLAGPRRHWLRGRLTELGVPFTFLGKLEEGDDNPLNALPREQLNELYNLVDLALISSRVEGGPHAVMEAAAAGCKMLSSWVGQAPDILAPACLFRDLVEAIDRLRDDVTSGSLDDTVAGNLERVSARCSLDSSRAHLQAVYDNIDSVAVYQPATTGGQVAPQVPPRWQRAVRRVLRRLRPRPEGSGLRVGIWQPDGPAEGRDPFLTELHDRLRQRGVEFVANEFSAHVTVWLLTAAPSAIPEWQAFHQRHPVGVVRLIDALPADGAGADGEGTGPGEAFDRQVTTFTIVPSAALLRSLADRGQFPARPVIIPKAVDAARFHATGRAPLGAQGRKLRIVASAGSDSLAAGAAIYRQLDEQLDVDRFEVTLLGEADEAFAHLTVLPPPPPEGMAGLLREADVYLATGRDEPCDTGVIAALACGVPVLYLEGGGTAELVQFGGRPFTGPDDVLPALEGLVEHLPMYGVLRSPPAFDQVVDRYLEVLRLAAR